jgi:hypothetical protein
VAKEKKLKVPKRIAGVKMPKKFRKPLNKALAIAENPATRDLAVAALTAAAAALARKGTESGPRRPGEPGTDPDRAGTLADVIIAAALDGARRLLDPSDAPSDAPEPPGAPVKPRRRGAAASARAPAAEVRGA